MLDNIKLLRNERKISQEKLGEICGVSQQSIYKYESLDVEPELTTLKKMADYFEVSIDYLVGHTDVRNVVDLVAPAELTNEEWRLVRNYRMLPENSQKIIDDLIADIKEKTR